MNKWQNQYKLSQKENKKHYSSRPKIPAMRLQDSRLAHLLKKYPSNTFFQLDFQEESRFNNTNGVIVFWQYLGNNILTIKSISNMILENPIIIIDDAYEGLLTAKKVDFILKHIEKITDNIIICSSNTKLSGEKIIHCDFHIANRYYDNIDVQGSLPNDHCFNRSKKFLCLNNLPRLHRLRMVDYFLENKLDLHSYLSCSRRPVIDIVNDLDDIDDLENSEISYHDKLLDFQRKGWMGSNPIDFEFSDESKQRLENNLPLDLDLDESTRGKLKHFTPKAEDYFNDSYWSIVNERDFFETDFLGYTEKVLKCFYFKHPFVVCGLPFTIEKLQSLGFLTFGHIIDESYDQETDNEKRFDMVCEQIEKLHKMNYAEHFILREKIKPILDYNQQLYIKLNKDFLPNKIITRVLEWYSWK